MYTDISRTDWHNNYKKKSTKKQKRVETTLKYVDYLRSKLSSDYFGEISEWSLEVFSGSIPCVSESWLNGTANTAPAIM
jgi:hypothetical protein